MTQEPSGPVLPAALRRGLADAQARGVVDPFAAPAPPPVRKHVGDDDVRQIVPTVIGENDELALCACACGCGNASAVRAAFVAGHAASKRVRCDECIDKGGRHLPGAPERGAPQFTQGVLRAESRRSEREKEWDRLAIEETNKDRLAADTQRWHDALESKWRDADLARLREHPDAAINEKVARVHRVVTDRLQRLAAGQERGEHKGMGMLLVGPPGSGKTWVAYAFLNMAVRQGLLKPGEIKRGTEADLLAPLSTGTFAEKSEYRKELHRERYKVLFIDDVGQAQGAFLNAESRRTIYNDLLDFFYRDGARFVIMTTNLDANSPAIKRGPDAVPSPLEDYIGSAAYSRLYANIAGGSGYLPFPDRDIRGQLAVEGESEWVSSL